MAKRRLSLANYGYILITILAMQTIGLAGFITVQCFTGKLAAVDLLDMLQVLAGTHKYVQSQAEYADYHKYLAAREQYWKKLDELAGDRHTRENSAAALRKQRALQQEEANTLKRMLEKEKQDVEAARQGLAKERKRLEQLRQLIKDKEERAARRRLDARRKKLKKVLGGMDAEMLGKYFSSILRKDPVGGPIECARLMHAYLKGTLIAETMEEMADEDRQKILPVLEHKYAAWAPEKIARDWTREKIAPEIMTLYLRQMSVGKAFKVISFLKSADRAKVVQVLQSQSQ